MVLRVLAVLNTMSDAAAVMKSECARSLLYKFEDWVHS